MNTTDIFIEHLIAGVQVGVWLLLLFLSVFGYEWVNIEQIQQMQLILAVILLPFIYPLGIVVDNIADEILQPLHRRIRKSVVGDKDISTARLMLRLQSEHTASQLDYIRRRIRISRSTFINMIIITITSVIFTIGRLQDKLNGDFYKALIFEIIIGSVFIYLSWNSWADFTTTQYKRVKELYSELNK
ncbi:MAG: hypothetical protein US52_C0057G0003 [candidate division WS6 bacterium GW2011_GWA2_37_6]|uniref:Uncharacterized protein n=1 Tax=candidate division WS6 bacterium GW2011_GWA2_37_6 TaxID=1619087 RepID=A0A0G0GWM7_9BACT|nr:MAG: hypothetical protein US52_C0057G0003 [candidate division WS6 bacterium GW2011_GWA2_37_6]